jgi:peptidoglycan-associated lipoprotein
VSKRKAQQDGRTIELLSIVPMAAGLVMSLLCLDTALAETRVALVIGNGAYQEGTLDNPPRDAELIAEALRGLDFDVTIENDLSQNTMRRLIQAFGDRLKKVSDAFGFFYYSGHGMQVKGLNYMIPIDASINDEPDVEIYGVPIWSVLTRMEYARTRMSIIVLDACRNNPFEKRFKSPQEGIGLSPMRAPPATLIAYATAPGDVADPGPRGGYSPFTEALAEELRSSSATVLELFNSVSAQVYSRTGYEQTPYIEFTSLPTVPIQLPTHPNVAAAGRGEERSERAPGEVVAVLPPSDSAFGPAPGSQEELQVTIGDRVIFESDTGVLSPAATSTLDRVAAWLDRHRDVTITVEGHTDERGEREYNLKLGERHAQSVRNYLVALGVSADRIDTVSYGEERPLDPGHDEAAWSQNRRAVIVVNER